MHRALPPAWEHFSLELCAAWPTIATDTYTPYARSSPRWLLSMWGRGGRSGVFQYWTLLIFKGKWAVYQYSDWSWPELRIFNVLAQVWWMWGLLARACNPTITLYARVSFKGKKKDTAAATAAAAAEENKWMRPCYTNTSANASRYTSRFNSRLDKIFDYPTIG